MLKAHLFRIIMTTYILAIAKIYNLESVGILILIIFFTDGLDGSLYGYKTHSHTFEYQRYDKIIDLATYFAIWILFNHLFDTCTQWFILAAMMYRLVGVSKFYHSNDNQYLVYYPDLVNVIIITFYLSKRYHWPQKYYYHTIIILSVLKILYEKMIHDRNYQ